MMCACVLLCDVFCAAALEMNGNILQQKRTAFEEKEAASEVRTGTVLAMSWCPGPCILHQSHNLMHHNSQCLCQTPAACWQAACLDSRIDKLPCRMAH